MDCCPIATAPPILIVDDDQAHAESTRALLAAHQYDAVIETDPVVAVAWLKEHEATLLLLDLNMPQMSGLEVLEQLVPPVPLTATPDGSSGPRMKTIVISGEQEIDTVAPLLRLGAYDFLPKPYDTNQLLRTVAHALGEWHLEHENARMLARERKTDELNRFLLSAYPNLLYVLDEFGNYSFINNKLEHLFTTNRESLIGRPWGDLFVDQPELKGDLAYRVNERRTGLRSTRNLEIEVTAGSGERAVLECTAQGLYQPSTDLEERRYVGTYGVLQDVTESRQTRRALVQSQRKFQGLFMESPDGVFISSVADGEVVEGNDSFNQLRLEFGASADATDAWLWPNTDAREEFVQALRRAPEHLSISVQRDLGDEERYLEINARFLELENEPCMLGTVRDRTRERRAELQQLELQSQLQQAGKMEALGQLAGGIAHDFNNILASIIGYAELVQVARSRMTAEQVDEYLSEVVTAGQRARDLISQMLTFTRANRGETATVPLTEVIEEVASMLRAAIPSTIEIHKRYEEGLPPVQLDPVQFQQVVMNLMINARDAIDATGEIELSVQRRNAAPACHICGEQLPGEHICLTVRDSGHGIPEDVLPRIFDMYYTTRAPGKGTGIGLWLVDGAVHGYGGHVTLTSSPNGTAFSVHLPMEVEQAAPQPDQESPTSLDGTIVVVDDEVSVSSFLGEILRHAGYETVVFNESPKAMDFLVTHLDEVGVLVTDQAMPMLSGMDLAQFVKGRKPDLPVVLITGFTKAADANRLEEIGVDHFLSKPFGIEQLLSVIGQATDRAGTAGIAANLN